MRVIATIGTAILLACPVFAQDGQPFNPGCTPPFTAEPHPIDSDCAIEGAGTDAPKKLESRAKNNFCAVGAGGSSSQARVTFVSFGRLQNLTEKQDFELADGRTGARGLYTTSDGIVVGEGDVVMISGFVIRADIANISHGESVNCKRGKSTWNDVHIHVAPTASKAKANFCKAVIAEMSPHLRPDNWNGGNLMLADGIPVRLTGQLFYDTSHTSAVCPSSTRDKAKARASSWEIHPVYRVDVCRFTTLQTCDPREDSKWKTFDEWLAEQEEENGDGS